MLQAMSGKLKWLEAAGRVRRHRTRGTHPLRREHRACFGETLHLDGSRHP